MNKTRKLISNSIDRLGRYSTSFLAAVILLLCSSEIYSQRSFTFQISLGDAFCFDMANFNRLAVASDKIIIYRDKKIQKTRKGTKAQEVAQKPLTV